MRLAVVHRHMVDAREGDAQELDVRKLLQDVFLKRHVREHDKLRPLGARRLFRVVLRRRIAVDHLKVLRQILLFQRLRLRLRDPQRLRDYEFHANPPFLECQECLDASPCPASDIALPL